MNGNKQQLWNALNALIHYNIAFNVKIVMNARLVKQVNI